MKNKNPLLFNAIILSYVFLLIVGGIIGHAKGSLESMVASLSFALLLLIGLFFHNQKKEAGKKIILFTLAFLTCFFLYRFSLSFKFMPSGMMTVLSAFTGYLAYSLKKI